VKVIIAGASGFLGQALQRELIADGHRVSALVRRPPRSATEIEWHPDRHLLDPDSLAGADAVIGLSGAGIEGKRWNAAYKKLLRDSRVDPTTTIANALASLDQSRRPAVFVCASAVGYYGERGDEVLDETAGRGEGFLAGLVAEWEESTRAAAGAGVRVVTTRTGLVLAASGGLMKRLTPIYKAGIGGKLGSGKQYQSWISLADELGAIRHVLQTDSISGPVNLTGPEPVRNAEFSKALGAALHRPALFPTPVFGIRLVLGEFADQGALASERVVPRVLLESGYQFQHPDVTSALAWAVAN
jgi:uncharacterized protein (TIGR01777 family)